MEETLDGFLGDLAKKQNEKIEAEELYNTYGSVKLEDGTIVAIRNNFIPLCIMWQTYNLCKSLKQEKEMYELLSNTSGGLIDCGDVVLRVEDIRAIFRPERHLGISDEEQSLNTLKNISIFNHLDDTVYGYDENLENIDDEGLMDD